ncbi:MAG: Lrp/AsnC family transcriptional regulator [Candidatus Freyarchaeota archaeon]|nr:Lrp/AsnC family transcriptional regulator [Candidatus Freyrarchaeum guaymaensis]
MSSFERLDEKDKAIITILSEDPDASQESIAERIGLSQPSVAVRIRKLRSAGVISKLIGVNPSKMGVYIAKVEVTTRNPIGLLETFKNCPYFMNGFIVSGRTNVCMLFLGENIETIETIVDAHIRPNEDVQSVEFNIIISSVKDFIAPIRMRFEKTDKPPCGSKILCKDCSYFKKNKCLGCPAIGQYKGKLW